MADAIEVRGLHKSYGDVEAVRGIDLSVPQGQIFALLGPNGAGKTTTVEILEGFRSRNAGEVSVLGFDPARSERELKSRIGIVLQSTGVDEYLTVSETIELYRRYYPTPRPLDEIVDVVGLTEKRDTRVGKLSGGQQRRLDVAIGLAGDPELLFLDEPTTGFDPAARRGAWQMVENLRSLGKTVLLTTHYMDEAQALADELAVIDRGRIVAQGTPETLGGRAAEQTRVRFRVSDGPDLPERLRQGAIVEGGRVSLTTDDPVRLLHELTSWAIDRRIALQDLQVSGPTLEDTYMRITSAAEEGDAT